MKPSFLLVTTWGRPQASVPPIPTDNQQETEQVSTERAGVIDPAGQVTWLHYGSTATQMDLPYPSVH